MTITAGIRDAQRIQKMGSIMRFSLSPLFQFFLMLITFVCFILILQQAYTKFRPQETRTQIQSLSPSRIKMFGGVPAKVTIGLYVEHFSQFAMLQGKFAFEGLLWFEFNPVAISLKEIEDITINNGRIDKRSIAFSHYLDGNTMVICYHVTISLDATLNYKRFPVDSHALGIWFTHRTLSPKDIIFESAVSNLMLDQRAQQSGWVVAGLRVFSGYVPYKLSSEDNRKDYNFPYLLFSIDYARNSLRDGLTIFLPLLFMLFLSLCTFSLEAQRFFQTNYIGTAGSITGILAYRFVIESMAPRVGYFMISDYCFFLFLILALVVFFTNLFTDKFERMYLTLIVIGIHAVFIGGFSYLLLG